MKIGWKNEMCSKARIQFKCHTRSWVWHSCWVPYFGDPFQNNSSGERLWSRYQPVLCLCWTLDVIKNGTPINVEMKQTNIFHLKELNKNYIQHKISTILFLVQRMNIFINPCKISGGVGPRSGCKQEWPLDLGSKVSEKSWSARFFFWTCLKSTNYYEGSTQRGLY